MKSRAVVAAVVLLAGLVAPQVNAGAGSMKFTEQIYDFGCVGVDFKVLHNFKLVNDGAIPIRIDTVAGYCDCTEVRFLDSTLAPGDTVDIQIIFSTADFYGPVEKNIKVHSSDTQNPWVQVAYGANVGQWLMKVEPQPVSAFFLPNQKTKAVKIVNHALDRISIQDKQLYDDLVDVKVVTGEAEKAEALELLLTPKPGLPSGTHTSNFTLSIDLHQDIPALRITIPVKIVVY